MTDSEAQSRDCMSMMSLQSEHELINPSSTPVIITLDASHLSACCEEKVKDTFSPKTLSN